MDFLRRCGRAIKALAIAIAQAFDNLPTPVKIIIYGFISGFLTLLDKDVTRLDVTNPYSLLVVTFAHNILVWTLFNLDKTVTGLKQLASNIMDAYVGA